MNQKFPKSEKLKSSKTIESLFLGGSTYSKYPIKVFYLPKTILSDTKEEIEIHQAAFAVPKRNFRSAVDRNRVKRQLREVYRLNKPIIETSGKKFVMLFLYLGKVKPKYSELDRAMVKLLINIKEEIGNK